MAPPLDFCRWDGTDRVRTSDRTQKNLTSRLGMRRPPKSPRFPLRRRRSDPSHAPWGRLAGRRSSRLSKIPKVPTPPAKVRSLARAMGPPRWPSQQPDGPFHEPFAHHNKPTTNRTVRQHDVHTPRLGPSALCIVCHSFCLFLGDSTPHWEHKPSRGLCDSSPWVILTKNKRRCLFGKSWRRAWKFVVSDSREPQFHFVSDTRWQPSAPVLFLQTPGKPMLTTHSCNLFGRTRLPSHVSLTRGLSA